MANVDYLYFPGLLGSSPATGIRVYRVAQVDHGPVDIHTLDGTAPNEAAHGELDDPVVVSSDHESATNAAAVVVETRKKGKGRKRPLASITATVNSLEDEAGLEVPGPVQRLPGWLECSLARHTQRRWRELAEKAPAAPPPSKQAKLNRSASSASFTDSTDQISSATKTPRGGKTKKPSRKRGRVAEPIDCAESDARQFDDLVKEEPALRPSPFAALNGLSQYYISLRCGGRGSEFSPFYLLPCFGTRMGRFLWCWSSSLSQSSQLRSPSFHRSVRLTLIGQAQSRRGWGQPYGHFVAGGRG